MRGHFLLLLLVYSLVTAIAAEASPGGSVPPTPAITALLYDHIGVPQNILDDAMQAVTHVYSRAGVTIAWTACVSLQTGRRLQDPCKHELKRDELVVRITRPAKSPQWKVRPSALGVAVVRDGATGFYLSVYYGRIKDLADSQRVKPGLVLGYAIAHEVGHLLLRSTTHSSVGLMRGAWDSESRKQALQGCLNLLSEQSIRVREEAGRRVASAGLSAQPYRAGN